MITPLLTIALLTPPGATPAATVKPAFDWANHTFQMGDASHTLKNGEWEHEPTTDDEMAQSLSLTGVHAIDIDRDGIDEALVALHHWPGGAGRFDELRLYRHTPTGPVMIAEIPGGDRGDGGIGMTRVEDGIVHLERMVLLPNDLSCCASLALIERWQWQDGKMVRLVDRTTVTAGPAAAEDGPGDPKAALAAGREKMKDDPAEAARYLTIALAARPDDAAIIGELGFALQKADQTQAEAVLWGAVNAKTGPNPARAAALYNLGRLYLARNTPAPAIAALERSLTLRPGNKPTLALLETARAATAAAAAPAPTAAPAATPATP